MEQHSITTVKAYYLGEKINLRTFEKATVAEYPLTIQAGTKGHAVIFRYGVIVVFNLSPIEEASFLDDISQFVVAPLANPESELRQIEYNADKSEGIHGEHIVLQRLDTGRIQLIGGILAKSVTLSYYEKIVSDSIQQVEPLAENLRTKGRSGVSNKSLLRHVGETLVAQHKMLGRVEVQEKPEILWENPELERLYARLEEEYELPDRMIALTRKLELISSTVETLIELVRHRSSLRVEWYITILIVIEIFITLYEMFFAHR